MWFSRISRPPGARLLRHAQDRARACLNIGAQDFVHAALVAVAFCLEPLQHVGIEPDGQLLPGLRLHDPRRLRERLVESRNNTLLGVPIATIRTGKTACEFR